MNTVFCRTGCDRNKFIFQTVNSVVVFVNDQIKTLTDEKAAFEAKLTEKDGQIAKYEIDSVKTRIAREAGLSYEAISFLQGEDEEAIKKSGFQTAVQETDAKLLSLVQTGVRSDLFGFLNGTITGATTVVGAGLQKALAKAWGQLQVLFEDDTAEAVYFLNPLDVAEYLANASITVQTASVLIPRSTAQILWRDASFWDSSASSVKEKRR